MFYTYEIKNFSHISGVGFTNSICRLMFAAISKHVPQAFLSHTGSLNQWILN